MGTERTTKYKSAVLDAMSAHGHATNAELAKQLRQDYPDLSDTTVHRVTARLLDAGKLSLAPTASDGSYRYDANLEPHDHFVCDGCGGLRDIDVANSLIPLIEKALGNCKITGRLVVRGTCEKCNEKRKS